MFVYANEKFKTKSPNSQVPSAQQMQRNRKILFVDDTIEHRTWNISITCDEKFRIFGMCVLFDTATIQLIVSHFEFHSSSDSNPTLFIRRTILQFAVCINKLKFVEMTKRTANKHSFMHSYQSHLYSVC